MKIALLRDIQQASHRVDGVQNLASFALARLERILVECQQSFLLLSQIVFGSKLQGSNASPSNYFI